VGKGYGGRAYYFGRRNKQHKNLILRHGKQNILIYIFNCESEQHAHKYEKWMILWCRAQGYRLANRSDGGEGVSGNNKVKFPSSNKERAATFKKRMRAAGFVQTAFWVHADDLDKVKKSVTRLRKKRMQDEPD
jgi:predicted GIY-YIG superfamily endonuclease